MSPEYVLAGCDRPCDAGLAAQHDPTVQFAHYRFRDRGTACPEKTRCAQVPCQNLFLLMNLSMSIGLDLLEKVLVDLLNVQRILDSAPYVVADHELGQLLTVDENNPLTQKLRRISRRG